MSEHANKKEKRLALLVVAAVVIVDRKSVV